MALTGLFRIGRRASSCCGGQATFVILNIPVDISWHCQLPSSFRGAMMTWVTRMQTFLKCLWIDCKTSGSRYRVYSDCEGLTDAVSAPTVKGKVNASQSIYEANAGAGAESCGTWDPEINGLRSAHTVRGSVWSLYPSLVKIISTHKVLQMCTNWQGWKDVVSVFYQSSEGSEKYKLVRMHSLRRLVPDMQKIQGEI